MNWGDRENPARALATHQKPAPCPDPLRRKVMSALVSLVDKHRRVLEEHDQVVITIHLDWRKGKLRETVMAVLSRRPELPGKLRPTGAPSRNDLTKRPERCVETRSR